MRIDEGTHTVNATQFRQYIVEPALAALPFAPTPFASDLLIATCATESSMGRWFKQIGGPALSVYQFEPVTLADLWHWVGTQGTKYSPAIAATGVAPNAAFAQVEDAILYNLRFATILARLLYYRKPAALPTTTTIASLWSYYKPFWNTYKGATTLAEFTKDIQTLTDIRGV